MDLVVYQTIANLAGTKGAKDHNDYMQMLYNIPVMLGYERLNVLEIDETMFKILEEQSAIIYADVQIDGLVNFFKENKRGGRIAADWMRDATNAAIIGQSYYGYASNIPSRSSGKDADIFDAEIAQGNRDSSVKKIPAKANEIAQFVMEQSGAPPQGYKGGGVYKNAPRDGAQKLPEGINYKEYDINPYTKGENRGSERIVMGDDGSAWYTNDHYTTFSKME